jgi:hypothetical protein
MGAGDARERGVVGETPNLAARLQALAEPGSVVTSESTRRLLGRTFELKALGPQELKGFKVPVSAWSIVRESENVDWFEASRSEAVTALVGREYEVALLIAQSWACYHRRIGDTLRLDLAHAGVGGS